jgi:hypothetical protein
MRQRIPVVWVVEASYREQPTGWYPTVGVALCRADARKVLAEWRKRNPHDRFRLAEYRPHPPGPPMSRGPDSPRRKEYFPLCEYLCAVPGVCTHCGWVESKPRTEEGRG